MTSPELSAFSAGYKSRLSEKDIESCPFMSVSMCASWTKGWMDCDEGLKKKNKEGDQHENLQLPSDQ
jgi:ribosome modulation factor